MESLKQPDFGRRLKQLRTERHLSQAALAGEGMSPGYLSRLESGARPPTAQMVAYLAQRLDITVEKLAGEPGGDVSSLARALVSATSAGSDAAVEALAEHGALDPGEDPFLRAQALWLLADVSGRTGSRQEEQNYLERLVSLSDDLGLDDLRSRARSRLGRSLRATGAMRRAREIATGALEIARGTPLDAPEIAGALITMISIEAEDGQLTTALSYADELRGLVPNDRLDLRAEALWASATVRVRLGDYATAERHLEETLQLLATHHDANLWLRARLATASLYLQLSPPKTEMAHRRLVEVSHAVEITGSPLYRQEMQLLLAYLAYHEGRLSDARAAYEALHDSTLLLTYRDKARLAALDGLLLISEGKTTEGTETLEQVASSARDEGNLDLTADIWRLLAKALAGLR
ncbi:helix-turn-helix domain-containing protein [Streptomyces sp. NPDC058646]|uniref:helix-turn-helix domain-containing protein n=1 Tax=Streptomyces sp. NPDC058646 TaxID=3346574 RepID=UPI0036552C3A